MIVGTLLLKWIIWSFHFAAHSICWKGVQRWTPRLYMSTPNRTFSAGKEAFIRSGLPIVSAAAPTVFRKVRRSAAED